ncbi:hypothetical protein [Ideonella sp. BN130291]|uniref:hypothetical protein n=1 Tax=Ideonella sp. BN130291 TaxID=3112940 RepID=UPI002E26F6DA|nr:hypothetical protein [Ideonella sp. BN130291]
MVRHHHHPGLELDDNLRQQQREGRLQRIARPLLYALLLAIALGLLGDGPLARAHLSGQPGVVLDHPRFARRDAMQELHLSVMPVASRVVLQLDTPYLQQVSIEQVVPQPAQVQAQAQATLLVFHATPGVPLQVQLQVKATHPGRLQARWRADNGPALEFSQFVYP